jgi:hypothetical protein
VAPNHRLSIRSVLLGIAAACATVVALALVVLTSEWAAQRVRTELVEILEARFDATVSVGQVSLSLFPRVAIDGQDLLLTRTPDRHTLPFIHARQFHVSGSPLRLLRRSVDLVVLDGLEIRVAKGADESKSRRRAAPDLTIGEIQASRGLLLILPDDPDKLPLRFDLEHIKFRDFSFERAGHYEARLTNPKPTGFIDSSGSFGPWNTFEPRSTPLSGEYTFTEAKLATIPGLGGTLSSKGRFEGVLERIEVSGTTETPDFQLAIAGQPLSLNTRFRAVVDGTSGDTFLNEVDATLGESHIVARGSVAGAPGAPGRTVSLEVKADGPFEDFLRLSVKSSRPPMRGVIRLATSFALPPGEADVVRRMQLAGTFGIQGGRFTTSSVQRKVDELSRRGRGEPESDRVNAVSSFGGAFTLRNGNLRLRRFQFGVDGARVELSGGYNLPSQELAFSGLLMLDAPVSKTTTGVKSLLLKLIDPLFRKDGKGTVLPVTVSGTVEHPSFRVDLKKALLRGR